MSDSANDRDALAETWLRYARSDEENAVAILTNHEGNAAGVCFLAQQIAEKYLKALLVALSGTYERTHDFGRILMLLEPYASGITNTLRDAALTLDPYYIGVRYPADLPIESLTWNQAEEAAAAARSIKRFVLDHLGRSERMGSTDVA